MGNRQTDRLQSSSSSKEATRSIVEMTAALSEAPGFREGLEKVLEILVGIFDYRAAWVFLQDPVSGDVSFVAQKGLSPEVAELERDPDFAGCIVEYVLRSGQVIAVKDVCECTRLRRGKHRVPEGLGSHVAIPIRVGWKCMGVLNVGTSGKRNFPLPEVQYLATVAGIVSLGLRTEQRGGADEAGGIPVDALRRVVDKLADGLMLMENDATVTLLNLGGRSFLEGLSEIEKGEFFDRFGRIQGSVLADMRQNDGRAAEYEVELAPPGGKTLRVSAVPFAQKLKIVEKALLLVKDVSTEMVRDRRLRMDERVATVGMILEGLSHELNNPLAAVSGYLQYLDSKTKGQAQVQGLVQKALGELDRAIAMLRNFMDMKKTDRSRWVHQGVQKILVELFEEFRPAFDRCGIEGAFAAPRDLPPVWMDEERMAKVFRNILGNAVQKIEEGSGKGEIHIACQVKAGYVQVVFTDSGTQMLSSRRLQGYGPSLREDLTVKDRELSLAFCHAVVQEHDGVLYARSGEDGRTGFIVELPVATPGEAKPKNRE